MPDSLEKLDLGLASGEVAVTKDDDYWGPRVLKLLEALGAPQVLKIIDLLTLLEGHGSRDATLRAISDITISADKINERKSYPPEFLKALWARIKAADLTVQSTITGYIAGQTGQTHNRLEKSFKGWIDAHDVASDSFAQKCANKKGNYLIFSCSEGTSCEVSEMNISADPSKTLLPKFETTYYKDGAPQAQVKGVIFEVGNYAYSIGKSYNNRAMRFSKLQPYTRPGGETDLYGIRVATSSGASRPYAHFIYCYQLRRKRTKTVLKRLLSVNDIKADILDQEIDEIEEIRTLLTNPEIVENGIVSQKFGDH